MNITTLLHSIRDVIHDAGAVQAWCVAKYSRVHRVYVGIDTANPPGAANYPLVHLFPVYKSAGYDLATQAHGIGCTCGIHDDSLRVTGKTNVVEYSGIENLEAFRKLVETAIVSAVPAELTAGTVETDYETIDFFPYFLCNMTWRFNGDYYQGCDVWE